MISPKACSKELHYADLDLCSSTSRHHLTSAAKVNYAEFKFLRNPPQDEEIDYDLILDPSKLPNQSDEGIENKSTANTLVVNHQSAQVEASLWSKKTSKQLLFGVAVATCFSLMVFIATAIVRNGQSVISEARNTTITTGTTTDFTSLGRNLIGCGVFSGKKSCYYIPLTAGSFDDMTKFCKTLNMQMVVLETWEEYTFISDIIKKDNIALAICVSIKWLSGKFTWIYPNNDTSQLDYGEQSPWAPREPNSWGDEACVYFWAKSLGEWDDHFCSSDYFTVCELMN